MQIFSSCSAKFLQMFGLWLFVFFTPCQVRAQNNLSDWEILNLLSDKTFVDGFKVGQPSVDRRIQFKIEQNNLVIEDNLFYPGKEYFPINGKSKDGKLLTAYQKGWIIEFSTPKGNVKIYYYLDDDGILTTAISGVDGSFGLTKFINASTPPAVVDPSKYHKRGSEAQLIFTSLDADPTKLLGNRFAVQTTNPVTDETPKIAALTSSSSASDSGYEGIRRRDKVAQYKKNSGNTNLSSPLVKTVPSQPDRVLVKGAKFCAYSGEAVGFGIHATDMDAACRWGVNSILTTSASSYSEGRFYGSQGQPLDVEILLCTNGGWYAYANAMKTNPQSDFGSWTGGVSIVCGRATREVAEANVLQNCKEANPRADYCELYVSALNEGKSCNGVPFPIDRPPGGSSSPRSMGTDVRIYRGHLPYYNCEF